MMKLSQRVQTLKSSTIMEISAQAADLKAKGHDVISLAAGEPDFNTPEAIQAATTKAMADGITKYTPAPGFLALREAVAEKVTRENKFKVAPEEVVITCGAKHAIYLTLMTLVDPGDVILVPTPAWVSYGPMIELAGARMFPLPMFEEDGFRPNVDRWKNISIPANAKGIFINSPNNPTGVTYTRDELTRLVAWAMQRNLWIMSDEIYEKILYDGAEHVSVASLGPEIASHTITISGFSKSHCMTGWRLGWAIGDKDVIKKMASYQSQSNSHVTSFVQWGALTAAKLPESIVTNMVAEFDRRRKYVMDRLDRLKGHVTYTRPTGAFYFYVNLAPWLTPRHMSDVEFCKTVLQKQFVGLVPGSTFGKENSIRLSYATSLSQLEKAFDRIEAFLKA